MRKNKPAARGDEGNPGLDPSLTLNSSVGSAYHKLSAISEELFQWIGKEHDYRKIAENVLELSDGGFIAVNIYDEDGKTYSTVAIAGDRGLINKGMSLMGMKLEGRKWVHDPIRAEKIKDRMVTHFPTLHDLAGEVISKPISNLLAITFGIGETVLVKIMKNDLMLGDLTLLMPRGKTFEQDSIIEIYARQLGLLIEQNRAAEKLRLKEEALQKSEEQYRLLITKMEQGLALHEVILDKKGEVADYRFLDINDSYERITGLKREQIIGKTVLECLPETEPYWIEKYGHVAMSGESLSFENYSKELQKHYAVVAYSPKPMQFATIVSDITEKMQKQKQIEFLSYTDQLTGLYNRRFYELEKGRIDDERYYPLSLVMADVNGLKLTNDAFGHQTGDLLLQKIARILKSVCREKDFVARIGGDEFVLLLPQTDAKNAQIVIRRINEAIKNEKIENVMISVSLGCAVKHETSEDIDLVFMKAEDEMYRQKLSESAGMHTKTIEIIMRTLFEKNKTEQGHSERVGEICGAIAEKMGFSTADVEELKLTGRMHDIGKIGIDETIFDKPGKLSASEWLEVKRHSEIGYKILSSANEFSQLANDVLQHHERWDGTGYPKGLKGQEISLRAGMIAVADAFDAMTHERAYRKTMTEQEAVAEMKKCSGTQFDPELVKVFVEQVLGE